MLRKRVTTVAVLTLLAVALIPASAGATRVDQLPPPDVGCNYDGCMFGAPEGVVHDGVRFQASSRDGAFGCYGWWEHFSEQPSGTYWMAQVCNGPALAEGRDFTEDECGPWSPVQQVPEHNWNATGSVNGYPCGGDLPPCNVLERESRGDPSAQNPNSTASGLWQFLDSTWDGYGGYAKARYAPARVQNDKAAATWDDGAGCSHWSACG